jgi:imidazolonepropionase-like amidohydrolase
MCYGSSAFQGDSMTVVRLIALFLFAFVSSVGPAQAGQGIAIVGADVLPMTGKERLSDQTVLIWGDRIVKRGARRQVRVPKGYRVIDARGLTLMPGLIDMHVHLDNTAGEESAAFERGLALMLAHGITTVRSTVGTPWHPELRARAERGEVISPRLYIGTQPLNGSNTKDVAAARERVTAAKGAGFDFLKVHDPEPEVWQTLIDEASKAGLPVVGHVTDQVGIFRALRARQQVEHLEMVPRELLPVNSPDRKETFGQIPPPNLVKLLNGVSDADIKRVAARAKAIGGYHGPNLAFFERVYDVVTPGESLLAQPDMSYTSAQIRAEWAQQKRELGENITPESGRTMRDLRRRIVRAFYDVGIPIMAGSAAPEVYQPYGSGLAREMETFVEIGFTPMDTLRSATVIPRDYFRSLPRGGSALGWKPDFGTIEAGARADIILLSDEPSKNISALRSLRTVIAAGKVYDRAALDGILSRAAADAKR